MEPKKHCEDCGYDHPTEECPRIKAMPGGASSVVEPAPPYESHGYVLATVHRTRVEAATKIILGAMDLLKNKIGTVDGKDPEVIDAAQKFLVKEWAEG